MVFHINSRRFVSFGGGRDDVQEKLFSIINFKTRPQGKGMGNEKRGNMQIKNHTAVLALMPC